MGSAPPTGWGRDLMDGPTAVGHRPRMSQRTALNHDQLTLERALRGAASRNQTLAAMTVGPLTRFLVRSVGGGAR
jgi:hypothetical protein